MKDGSKELETALIEEGGNETSGGSLQKDRFARKGNPDENLSRFFDVSRDLLCVAGFDGYFKRLSPAWKTRFGWTLEELQASQVMDFVNPEDRIATKAEIDNLREGEETILFENRFRHKNGSYRWLRWNAWLEPGGKRINATARDVTRQRLLEKEVIEILDREKERLGRDLHDGLCQTLAGIGALSSTLSKNLAANSESESSAVAAEITKLLNESIGQARELARGLARLGQKETGLDETLEAFALNVAHLFRVSCRLECDRPFPRFRPEVEAHLFRIAQEAVNNSIAHGHAERVEIRLQINAGKGVLSVLDDGIGISEKSLDLLGIGMHTMAYRSRLIGASLTVRRRTGLGTAVVCAFPLSNAADTAEYPGSSPPEGNEEIPK